MDYDPVDQYFDDLQDENDLMAYALEYFNEKRQKGEFTCDEAERRQKCILCGLLCVIVCV